MDQLTPFRLEPEYRDYIWGGERLRPGRAPTAEAWVVSENDRISSGPLTGLTLAEAAQRHGARLVGRRSGGHFPLLIKLLDCAQWLSLQVHPDDARAVELEGPGQSGKTEAWHVLEAAPGARLIAGIKPDVSLPQLTRAVQDGTILDQVEMQTVRAGDTVFIPAGTLHAIGPGLLLYEVQQASDWTYRVYDWGRPQTPTRHLHIEKSLAAIRPEVVVNIQPAPALPEASPLELVRCPYFSLQLAASSGQPVSLNTQQTSFHALTVIEGAAQVECGGAVLPLTRYQTALVPAACGSYTVRPASGGFRLLKAACD